MKAVVKNMLKRFKNILCLFSPSVESCESLFIQYSNSPEEEDWRVSRNRNHGGQYW